MTPSDDGTPSITCPPGAARTATPAEIEHVRQLTEEAAGLKAQGLPEQALVPQSRVHQHTWESGDWINFCRSAENLASLLVPLGRWAEAEAVSREAVDAAHCIADREQRWQRTTTALSWLGHALHGRGLLKQAATAYSLAEIVQADAHHHPKLYSVYGYNYAQLLLEQSCQERGWREVLERRHTSLDIAVELDHALSQALDHGGIGLARAALGEPDSVQSFDMAITTLQRAGSVLHLPAMHLARAHHHRRCGDLTAARADLADAQDIAQRGNLRTSLAECALLAGNLLLDEARAPEAVVHHATAARLIGEDGYGRRLAELHLLEARLLHARDDLAAPQALATAEARIRETGQWYFWRELRAVARETGAPDPGECPGNGTAG